MTGIIKFLPCIMLLIIFASCRSAPEIVSQPENTGGILPQAEAFDVNNITEEFYASTMEDIRYFIEELNLIIRRRDFNAWRERLSDEYFAGISSAENLAFVSAQPAMRSRRITLRTAEDFFRHVVVPSRANSRVDEIEFLSANRVQVFTVATNRRTGEIQRLRLFDLEKTGDLWLIIN